MDLVAPGWDRFDRKNLEDMFGGAVKKLVGSPVICLHNAADDAFGELHVRETRPVVSEVSGVVVF